jgi:hypothetical protein
VIRTILGTPGYGDPVVQRVWGLGRIRIVVLRKEGDDERGKESKAQSER